MFQSNRPSSGVQVFVIRGSAAHCNAALFHLDSCLGFNLIIRVNQSYYLGVLELHIYG
jgi:hypothetical protein